MSKDNNQEMEEIIKSLSQDLDMPEDELRDLLNKSEEDEVEKAEEKTDEEEKEDNSEEEKKEKEDMKAEKSEQEDLLKSIKADILKYKESLPQKEKVEKSESDDLMKSMEDMFSDKLEKAMSDVRSTFTDSLESLKSTVEDIQKSVNLIGSTSQGTKGVRFSSFLEKSGDTQPFLKDGKTIIDARDRETISNAMLDIMEKATDDDLKKSMSTDIINYQGSNELSSRAIMNLNKAGYLFKEQVQD